MIRGELILQSSDYAYRGYLFEGEQVLGRSPQADLVLPLPVVSRQQFRIVCNEQGCWIENLSHSNPTYLMGRPLTMPTRLRDGDLLGIGHLRLRFCVIYKEQQASPKAEMIVRQIGREDRFVSLTGERVLIGRDPRSDVVLDYPAISRRHLLLEWRSPQGFILHTLSSDPHTIRPEINGHVWRHPMPLSEGDEIWLGDGLGNGVTLIYRPSSSSRESQHG